MAAITPGADAAMQLLEFDPEQERAPVQRAEEGVWPN